MGEKVEEIYRVGNANVYFPNRYMGVSVAPYDSLNLAAHVGDEQTDVLKNRELLREMLSLSTPVQEWVFMNQVHENIIFHADREEYDYNNPPTADAAITSSRIPLVSMTADCGPLVIAGQSAMAVIHASWKTVAAGIIATTIAHLRELSPDDEFVGLLGPCIHPQSFEFGEELLNDLAVQLGSHVKGVSSNGTPAFDLPRSILFECERNGVEATSLGIDTYSSDDYFSYRRDAITGRQGVISWLT